MLLRNLLNISKKARPFSLRCCAFSSNQYYDSQSGRYMTVPGSQSIQLHDVSLRARNTTSNAKLDHLLQFYTTQLTTTNNKTLLWRGNSFHLNSMWKTINENNNDSIASKIYFPIEDYETINSIPSYTDTFKSFELDCTEHLYSDNKWDKSLANVVKQIEKFQDEKSNMLKLRVNLAINITGLVDGSHVVDSVSNIATSVGKLCDADVEVFNIVLCTTKEQSDDLVSNKLDEIEDFLRNLLEECIGLDVPGTAVIDRLSLTEAPQALIKVASSLGVKRFTTLSNEVFPYGNDSRIIIHDNSEEFISLSGGDMNINDIYNCKN